jgi:hypothetical protein
MRKRPSGYRVTPDEQKTRRRVGRRVVPAIGAALLVTAAVPGFTSMAQAAATHHGVLDDASSHVASVSGRAKTVKCRYTAVGAHDMAVFVEPTYQSSKVGVINAGDTVESPRSCGDFVAGDGGHKYAEVYTSWPAGKVGWVFSDELTNGH